MPLPAASADSTAAAGVSAGIMEADLAADTMAGAIVADTAPADIAAAIALADTPVDTADIALAVTMRVAFAPAIMAADMPRVASAVIVPRETHSVAFRAGEWGSTVNRGELNSFLGLPTDAGMHAASGVMALAEQSRATTARRLGAAARQGTSIKAPTARRSPTARPAQGIAGGPSGVAAGGKAVSGTAVKGPNGNVYTHTASAGRGVVAGSGGVAAHGYANGSIGHYFSPTYLHAQGVAANRWFGANGVFTAGWCAGHPWGWHPWGYTGAGWAAAAWGWATWPALGGWLAWDATPVYYDYGDNVTYQGDSVYYGSQPVATEQAYYNQALDLATSAPAEPAASEQAGSNPPAGAQTATDPNWLPLGVFGLMPEGKKTPQMVFQLAVNKEGVVRGNYYDQATDTVQPVHGKVDKQDQRIAWQVGNNKKMVIETGIYNLTENESTALVHLGPDETEQIFWCA